MSGFVTAQIISGYSGSAHTALPSASTENLYRRGTQAELDEIVQTPNLASSSTFVDTSELYDENGYL